MSLLATMNAAYDDITIQNIAGDGCILQEKMHRKIIWCDVDETPDIQGGAVLRVALKFTVLQC